MNNTKTLHLLRQSPFTHNDVLLCSDNLLKNDSVVLMDDGCYALSHAFLGKLQQNCENIFIIKQHALARGLSLNNNIQLIDIAMLNQFIFKHKNSVTWQ
jgi:sulfur relay protein TusB/DsrH